MYKIYPQPPPYQAAYIIYNPPNRQSPNPKQPANTYTSTNRREKLIGWREGGREREREREMRSLSSSSTPTTTCRTSCCSNRAGIKRGPWTPEEDEILADYIKREGVGRWRTLPSRAGLLRCGKSCRLRWMNYLRPSVKRGRIAPDEEDLILRLHRLLGNRYISTHNQSRSMHLSGMLLCSKLH